jgi:hypothetical protein
VNGVDVGVEQADGDGLVPRVRADSLDGRRLPVVEIVDPLAVVPLQEQDVAKPPGHQQRDRRALALEDRIGGHGGAVDEVGHLGERY